MHVLADVHEVHKQVAEVNDILHTTYCYMNCHGYDVPCSYLQFTCIHLIRYMILPAAVDYAENLVALSCGRLKLMSGPMATMP